MYYLLLLYLHLSIHQQYILAEQNKIAKAKELVFQLFLEDLEEREEE